jgi:hypothetical protein
LSLFLPNYALRHEVVWGELDIRIWWKELFFFNVIDHVNVKMRHTFVSLLPVVSPGNGRGKQGIRSPLGFLKKKSTFKRDHQI